ncbi:MAG: tetratricopeptide repeat protein [Acidobacteria bacterium]|nr:tetratricopeptide repeat protein [Acidobacteriota bacterium]MBS1864351.1 tetratricopeptide repeat protein [Acidobacteriota bacterium]
MNKLIAKLACFFAFLLILVSVAGAQQPSNDLSAEASVAYDTKDWAKSATLYEKLTQAHPEVPRAWFRLGASLQELGQLDRAIDVYNKALAAGAPPLYAEYSLAAVYAQRNQNEQAFEHLDKAVKAGYNKPDQLASDPYLASLRSDPRFAKLLEQTNRNLTPCAYTPENRQFDFWVGEWNVETTQGGIPAGQSRIEKTLGDCVILENWQSSGNPYSGKSYNIYNSALKRWEQFWVDNAGGNIFFYGELSKDGVLDYWTDEMPQPTGPKLKRHLQFIPMGPGKVRQFSRGSTDGGKTWNVEYDFIYLRKK